MLSGFMQSSSSESDSEDSGSEKSDTDSWITWFVSQSGNEFLLEVEEEYIRDSFNLYGLKPLFQYYEHALEMILDPDAPDEEDLRDRSYTEIYRDAAELYGTIHQRFAMSPRGLSLLKDKFQEEEFGLCPRTLCGKQSCLPIGVKDELRHASVRLFCPKCEQVYVPTSRRFASLDGAFFGTSLPQMFLQTYPDLLPLEPVVAYDAKIFGFRVHGHKSVIKIKQSNALGNIRIPRRIDPSALPPDDFDKESS